MSDRPNEWYHLSPSAQKYGPVTREELLTLHMKDRVARSTLVWSQGMSGWEEFGKVFDGVIPPPPPVQAAAPELAPTPASLHRAPAPWADGSRAMSLYEILFSLHGRVPRHVFWGWVAFSTGVQFSALSMVRAHLIDIGQGELVETSEPGVLLIVALVLLWPTIAISVKRWHDTNLSGYFVLLNAVPVVGWLISIAYNGFVPGTFGGNRFGYPMNTTNRT